MGRVAKRESHTIIAESMRVATQGRASMWTTRRASVRLTCSSVSQHNNVRRSSCSGAWNRKQQSWLAGKRRGNCRGRGTEQLRAASSAEMPSTLKGLVAAFSAVPDPMLRYKQLLHYAEKLEALPVEYQTPENKVEGCVSQVWVKGVLEQDGTVSFKADSDSQLTKGLAALLVKGLSGAEPASILSLSPDFIEMLGLKQSLTPSRNNGFLNMFLKMQQITHDLSAAAGESNGGGGSNANVPMSKKIEDLLRANFEPASLDIQDDSASHAGHKPESAAGGTHFRVSIVSDSFQGMNTIKRHKQIYSALADYMEPKGSIHALSLSTKTTSEVQ